MGKDSHSDEDPAANLLKMLMDQADDIDLTDPSLPADEQKNPRSLMIPGLQMSKLLAVIEFGSLHSADDAGILDGLDMISREQVIKQVNGTFQLNIKPSPGSGLTEEVYHFYVDLRKSGEIRAGPAP